MSGGNILRGIGIVLLCIMLPLCSAIASSASPGGITYVAGGSGSPNVSNPSPGSVLPFANCCSGTSPSIATNLNNATALLLPKWRAALARVRSGGGNARVAMMGDSTTLGVGSGATGTSGNLIQFSIPSQLATIFNAPVASINAYANGFMGAGNSADSGFSFQANDPRVSVGNSWSLFGTFFSLGGGFMTATTTTNAYSFTPTTTVDRCRVWYASGGGGNAVLGINFNGGTQTQVSIGLQSGNINSTTISGTLGLNTCNVTFVSGSSGVFVLGFEAWNSAQSSIQIINMGCSGSTSGNWNNSISGFGPIATLPLLAPDLTVINLGINDWRTGVSLATFTANIQALITAAKLSGDVVLVTPIPTDPVSSGISLATQQTFQNAIIQLGQLNNVPVFDGFGRWISYANSQPLGIYFDTIHANTTGYADIVQGLYNIIGNP